jgi:DNA-binding transcriptional LysR family regulator
MSRALEGLRDMFGDPLLVRNGRGYERTVRGGRVLRDLESLMPRLEDIVRGEKFGVLLYSVTRRLREFGVRMALGAARRALIQLVLRDSVWMLSGGIAAGIFLAFMVTPLLNPFLVPEVGARDLTAFVSAFVLLAGVAMAASVSPVLRALRVDPAVVLRYD